MSTPPSAFPRREKPFARISVDRSDPLMTAVTDKLVPADTGNSYGGKRRPLQTLDMTLFDQIGSATSENITAVKSLKQLLPDLELVSQIVVSSILSPKDLTGSELNYSVDPSRFNSDLAGPMLECIREYFENTYKMGELLPKPLEEALYGAGAYPLLILPENSIDVAINNPTRTSFESIRGEFDMRTNTIRSVGILGNAVRVNTVSNESNVLASLESLLSPPSNAVKEPYDARVRALKMKGETDAVMDFDPMTIVVDNPNILRLPQLYQKLRHDRLQDMLSPRKLGLEANRPRYYEHGLKDDKSPDVGSFYRRRNFSHQPVLAMTPSSVLKDKPVGHPLVLHLPTESVIPVHVPSNPEEHLGYFVLLDELGNPLVRAIESDYYANMSAGLANNDITNRLIQKTSTMTNGRMDPLSIKRRQVEQLTVVYGELMEEELNNRLRNGLYGENVQVGKPVDVYRIMFARALAKMRTQILYVPAEMLTYIAFDYNQFGIGESLIQKSKVIGGLRVMVAFANTMAALKNSISQVKMTINLDPNDDDPTGTVEFLVHEQAKLRSASFPLGRTDPADIINYFQNAGISVEVNGNTNYPETKVLLEDIQSARVKPDTEFEESLRKRHLMSLWTSPETVDAGANAQFATTVVLDNQLLAKRVILTQKRYMLFIQELIQKYTLSSGYLMEKLRQIVRENRGKLTEEDKRNADNASRGDQTGGHRLVDSQKPQTQSGGHRLIESQRTADSTLNEERPLETSTTAKEETGNDDDDVDGIIIDFVYSILTSLPAPDTTKLDTQAAAFTKYSETLDVMLAPFVNEDMMSTTEYAGMAQYVKGAVAAFKANFQRQWLRSNNVLPELEALAATEDADETAALIFESHEKHLYENFGKSFLAYLKSVAIAKKAIEEDIKQVVTDIGSGDDGGMGGDGGGGFGGDDTAGAGDANLDFGATGLDETDSATDTTATDTDATDGDLTVTEDATTAAGTEQPAVEPDAATTGEEGEGEGNKVTT